MTSISISSNIYIRTNDSDIQYSTTSDFSQINTISSWPVTLNNTNTSNPPQNVNVYITNDLTLNAAAANQYFIMGSNNITFDGQNNKVTIQGVGDYPGLIQNGTSSGGNNNIIIKNLGVETMNNSTLANSAGWIGQQYMNKNAIGCQVTNCYSTGGIIGVAAGGIFGQYSTGTATGCYSTGIISGDNGFERGGGGIFGSDSGGIAINCYSMGDITGRYAGGIFGDYSSGTATNCYSSGDISGTFAGGIFGYGGTATNCYAANGNWSDTNAVAANKLLNGPTYSGGTLTAQGSIWIDLNVANNVPFQLKSFWDIIYVRQQGSAIQYSTNINFTTLTDITSWPHTISLENRTIVLITTDLTLTTTSQYFIMGSDNIIFDGQNNKVFINVNGYPGLIQNGTSGTNGDGKNYIIIQNLGVETPNNSTLADYAGWIGQRYMNKNAIGCKVTNCYSTGVISG
jgi:hypothetical protein